MKHRAREILASAAAWLVLLAMARAVRGDTITLPTIKSNPTTADRVAFQADVQARINASKPGDTIQFDARSQYVTTEISFPTGRAYTSVNGRATIQNDANPFAVKIVGNGGISITGLRFLGAGIEATTGGQTLSGARISGNDFVGMRDARGNLITVANAGTVFEDNYVEESGWGFIVYNATDGSFSWNTYRDCKQVGQLVNFTRCKVTYNVGRGFNRMGGEFQDFNSNTFRSEGLEYAFNVVLDWKNPYWDSFSSSMMPQSGVGMKHHDNFTRVKRTGNWSAADSGGRLRFGIVHELGWSAGIAENNTVIVEDGAKPVWGDAMFTVAMPGVQLRGNKGYGVSRLWVSEGGWKGAGNAIDLGGNRVGLALKDAPADPAWAVYRMNNPLAARPDPNGADKPTTIGPVAWRSESNTTIDLGWTGETGSVAVAFRPTFSTSSEYVEADGSPAVGGVYKFRQGQRSWKYDFKLTDPAGGVYWLKEAQCKVEPDAPPSTQSAETVEQLRAQVAAITAEAAQARADADAGRITVAQRDATIADLRARLDDTIAQYQTYRARVLEAAVGKPERIADVLNEKKQ